MTVSQELAAGVVAAASQEVVGFFALLGELFDTICLQLSENEVFFGQFDDSSRSSDFLGVH